MEPSKLAVCRTCLGPLDFPRNLCDENYKYLLELLHRLLNFQVNIQGGIFNICRTCEGKLVWVSEFKDLCEKSCQKFRNNDCKEEFVDIIDDLGLGDIQNDYDSPDNSGSDSDYEVKPAKKRKRKIKDKEKEEAPRIKSKSQGTKWKFYRIEQFPENEVLEAIAEYESHYTNAKYRTCVCCNFEAASTAALRTHMSFKHKEVFDTWCKHCNIQTMDLKMHIDITRCHEQQCKFCKKISPGRKNFPLHLRSHCNKVFNPNKVDLVTKESVNQSENTDNYYGTSDITRANNDNDKNFSQSDNDLTDFVSDSENDDLDENGKEPGLGVELRSRRKRPDGPDQYSSELVVQAIEECRNYIKNRHCIHCDFAAESSIALRNHVKNAHGVLYRTWCFYCNIQTENLEIHRDTAKCCEHACKFCHKICGNMTELTQHLRSHCYKVFRDQNTEGEGGRLKQFSESEVLQAIADFDKFTTDLKNTSCIYCDFTCAHVKLLRRHMSMKHDDAFEKWCKNCNTHTEDIQIHKEVTKCHLQQCKFCGRLCSGRKNFPHHLKSHCLKVKENKNLDDAKWKACEQFSEDIVLKAISESSNYMTDIKNRSCIHCHYVGSTARTLTAHMTFRHTEVSENWCGRCNVQTDDIEAHKKSIRCYDNLCILCKKTFKRANHLLRHLELHCHKVFKKPERDVQWDDYLINDSQVDITVKPDITSDKDERTFSTPKDESNSNWDNASPISSAPENSDTDSSDSDKAIINYKKTRVKQFPMAEVQRALMEALKPFYNNRKCVICSFIATNSKTLGEHLNSHKNIKDKWCNLCNTLVRNVTKHFDNHKKDVLKCSFCDVTCESLTSLKVHLKRHCNSHTFELTPQWHCCTTCPSAYPTEKQLKNHSCKKPVGPNYCLICKKRVRNIRIHNRNTHKPKTNRRQKATPGSNDKLCPICGKIFKNNQNLTVHMRKHTGEKPFICSYCHKQFPNKPYLREHERRHTGERPYVCHVCGKGFVSNGDHKQHMQIHEGGPVSCTICNKEFSRPGVLKLHMRRHTGENPYACVECGISYHRPSLLKNHMRSHSNERPYKCSFCEKDFSSKGTLNKHERVHKGIKPYKCSICSFSCTQAHGLSSHMKQHPEDAPQPDRPYKCLFCHRQFDTNAMLMSHTANQHRDATR